MDEPEYGRKMVVVVVVVVVVNDVVTWQVCKDGGAL